MRAGGGPGRRGACTVLCTCRMIYKCAMCDTVFTHKPLLSSHFDQHLLPQRVSVFKCPSCPLLFAQKKTMLEHLKVQEARDRCGRSAALTCCRGHGTFWKWGRGRRELRHSQNPPQPSLSPFHRTPTSRGAWGKRLLRKGPGVPL